ncbi:unnamed protein product, partial [Durusdinium trenchii]
HAVQWIRFMNDYLVLMSELNYKVRQLTEENKKTRKSHAQRCLDRELQDRQSQTPTHYNRTTTPARYARHALESA